MERPVIYSGPDLVQKLSLPEAWQRSGDEPAVGTPEGIWSYDDLGKCRDGLVSALLGNRDDLQEERIAVLVSPGPYWVAAMQAVWLSGGIAVPLALMYPEAELRYVLQDTGCKRVLVDGCRDKLGDLPEELGLELIDAEAPPAVQTRSVVPPIDQERRALIIYTSGSTGKPKGVVTRHGQLAVQLASLHQAWQWSRDDRILCVLPLHHVHGANNVVGCALSIGARVSFLPRFDAAEVWAAFMKGEYSLFMAVPTIYHRLIAHWESGSEEEQKAWSSAVASMRLMVSGSAALPVSVLEKWREISGQTLLERYGMTEIGMALSNSYEGDRFPGKVGRPLPGMQCRVVEDSLQVRGPSVFREYWGRPEATAEAFDKDWFKTGDAVAVNEDGIFRIVGRESVDILKCGGYKVSAGEIEELFRRHESIVDCAVVGIPDEEMGQRIGMGVVATEELSLQQLRDWARQELAPYKLPAAVRHLKDLPRNAMGKVVKPRLTELFLQS